MKKIILSTPSKKYRPNYSKILKKHFGREWKYDSRSRWLCSDGKKYVQRYAPPVGEYGYPFRMKEYFLYDDEEPLKNISYLFFNRSLFAF